jgi:hypothetical protein
MKHALLIAASLLLAACNQKEEPAAPAPNAVAETPAPPVAKAPPPALEGTWKVASIDGKPAPGLTLTFKDGRATIAAGCVRRGFTFTQDRNRLSVASNPAGSSNCGSAPSADQEAAFAALGDINTAVSGKEKGEVTLMGYGGTLSLERR